MVWCNRCGGYSSTKLYKLAGACSGSADPSAQTRLACLSSLRHPTLGYRLRMPIRLTDPVIAQLKAAGERQRQGFARVLRDVLRSEAGGGDRDDAQPGDDQAVGGEVEEDLTHITTAQDDTSMIFDEGDGDVFGHGGSLDDTEGYGSAAAAAAPHNAGSAPSGATSGNAADDRQRAAVAADARARSEAARRKMQALKERIRGRCNNLEEAAAATTNEPRVHRMDDDGNADGRPSKFRRVETQQGIDLRHDGTPRPRDAGSARANNCATISDVGSLLSAQRLQPQAAREQLLAHLARPRTPPNLSPRTHITETPRGGDDARGVHERYQQARGVKRASCRGGDAANSSATPSVTKRRLVGKQPPRQGVG